MASFGYESCPASAVFPTTLGTFGPAYVSSGPCSSFLASEHLAGDVPDGLGTTTRAVFVGSAPAGFDGFDFGENSGEQAPRYWGGVLGDSDLDGGLVYLLVKLVAGNGVEGETVLVTVAATADAFQEAVADHARAADLAGDSHFLPSDGPGEVGGVKLRFEALSAAQDSPGLAHVGPVLGSFLLLPV